MAPCRPSPSLLLVRQLNGFLSHALSLPAGRGFALEREGNAEYSRDHRMRCSIATCCVVSLAPERFSLTSC
ncbi:hypothetical protein BD311DRAFT_754025 [Dichomitus squalens]|uniref:Uncharacterized protein n=1 Tax=Dichomitus squalens TaxID=114155 RepID=A0A4Q9MWB3_9APHY|nr:hypothetical protein BD311DRAFT_754025 [Dichomitus squalens]